MNLRRPSSLLRAPRVLGLVALLFFPASARATEGEELLRLFLHPGSGQVGFALHPNDTVWGATSEVKNLRQWVHRGNWPAGSQAIFAHANMSGIMVPGANLTPSSPGTGAFIRDVSGRGAGATFWGSCFASHGDRSNRTWPWHMSGEGPGAHVGSRGLIDVLPVIEKVPFSPSDHPTLADWHASSDRLVGVSTQSPIAVYEGGKKIAQYDLSDMPNGAMKGVVHPDTGETLFPNVLFFEPSSEENRKRYMARASTSPPTVFLWNIKSRMGTVVDSVGPGMFLNMLGAPEGTDDVIDAIYENRDVIKTAGPAALAAARMYGGRLVALGRGAAPYVARAGLYAVIAAEVVFLGWEVYDIGSSVSTVYREGGRTVAMNRQLRSMGYNPRDAYNGPGFWGLYGYYMNPWRWRW
jgi:hypothetical protein